ncbi:MAG: hypothetical protein Q4A61_03440 [Porphyromonadaceae bacterium]|nr:hypothetical protein [Porphyromonadaceae bacterium]
MKQHKFTIILDYRLREYIPEGAYRRLMRLELCEAFGLEGANKTVLLNQRAKRGKEPTASQLQAMKRIFRKYGVPLELMFDPVEGEA